MATKKDTLKSGLLGGTSRIKKKPIIDESQAEKVTQEIHQPEEAGSAPESEQPVAEETVKTSIDIRESLYDDMQMRLNALNRAARKRDRASYKKVTMRTYIETLIEYELENRLMDDILTKD